MFQRLYVEDIINDRKKNEQDIFQNLDNYDLTTKFDLQRKSILVSNNKAVNINGNIKTEVFRKIFKLPIH